MHRPFAVGCNGGRGRGRGSFWGATFNEFYIIIIVTILVAAVGCFFLVLEMLQLQAANAFRPTMQPQHALSINVEFFNVVGWRILLLLLLLQQLFCRYRSVW